MREEGIKVSSVTLRFLSPLEPGLKEIFSQFKSVMTVELNYSDDHDDPVVPAEHRRRSQLARLLRQITLIDVDCWSRVPGVPLSPSQVKAAVREKLSRMG
jgi:2-oxoglutarate ferredoxin oxidoreductase subunit alpha